MKTLRFTFLSCIDLLASFLN